MKIPQIYLIYFQATTVLSIIPQFSKSIAPLPILVNCWSLFFMLNFFLFQICLRSLRLTNLRDLTNAGLNGEKLERVPNLDDSATNYSLSRLKRNYSIRETYARLSTLYCSLKFERLQLFPLQCCAVVEHFVT